MLGSFVDEVTRVAREVGTEVVDQGLGIPPAEQSRIFEKFYIARELVRRVAGRIWVEPNDGPGSAFHVEIPAAEPSQSRKFPKRARASD